MRQFEPADSNTRPFVRSPDRFAATLEELYERFVLPNLPEVTSVRRCHELLREYVERDDPLFPVRQVVGTIRGETYATNDGSRFMATDNAPAWWMHYVTFRDELPQGEEFARAVESAPYHFFDVARRFPWNISSAGWHVAHILPVKNRNTDYQNWTRNELRRRFIRNVHPCNNFPLPKCDWQRWGGDPQVIAFFADAYQERYGNVWSEFLIDAEAHPQEIPPRISGIRYSCGPGRRSTSRNLSSPDLAASTTLKAAHEPWPPPRAASDASGLVPTYEARRLLFRAGVIEPLAAHERFRVVTPDGVFEMTKSQFYATFGNVVESRSYREAGVYHYPTLPRKARQFLTDRED